MSIADQVKDIAFMAGFAAPGITEDDVWQYLQTEEGAKAMLEAEETKRISEEFGLDFLDVARRIDNIK